MARLPEEDQRYFAADCRDAIRSVSAFHMPMPIRALLARALSRRDFTKTESISMYSSYALFCQIEEHNLFRSLADNEPPIFRHAANDTRRETALLEYFQNLFGII